MKLGKTGLCSIRGNDLRKIIRLLTREKLILLQTQRETTCWVGLSWSGFALTF